MFTTYLHTVFFFFEEKKYCYLIGIFLNDFKIFKPRDLCSLSFLDFRVLGYTRLRHNKVPEMCSKSEEILPELLRENVVQELRMV